MKKSKVLMSRFGSVSFVLFLSVFSGFAGAQSAAYTAPDPTITPGVLCTPSDPNFSGLVYPEQIAKCNRNVNNAEKLAIAASYGNIPQSEWPNYEFDHLIPLCAGGSDDPKNLWPQPIGPAHEKDKLEVDICIQMRAGTLTQADAVRKIRDWVSQQLQYQPSQPAQPVQPAQPAQPGQAQPSNPQAPPTTGTPKQPAKRRTPARHPRQPRSA